MLLVGFCTFPQAILHTHRSMLYPSLPRKHEYIAIGRYLRTCENHTPVASVSQTRQSNLQNLLLRRLHDMSRMGKYINIYIAIGRYLRTCEHHTPVANNSQTRQSKLQNLLLRWLHDMSKMSTYPTSIWYWESSFRVLKCTFKRLIWDLYPNLRFVSHILYLEIFVPREIERERALCFEGWMLEIVLITPPGVHFHSMVYSYYYLSLVFHYFLLLQVFYCSLPVILVSLWTVKCLEATVNFWTRIGKLWRCT